MAHKARHSKRRRLVILQLIKVRPGLPAGTVQPNSQVFPLFWVRFHAVVTLLHVPHHLTTSEDLARDFIEYGAAMDRFGFDRLNQDGTCVMPEKGRTAEHQPGGGKDQ